MSNVADCFRANDVRGRVADGLDEALVERIAAAAAERLNARRAVIGRDVRPSGEALSRACARGIAALGAEVLDLGLCGSEEVYFATADSGAELGIMVTASHNPAEYNGLKIVGQDARPVGVADGLRDIQAMALAARAPGRHAGQASAPATPAAHYRRAYLAKLLDAVDRDRLRPLTILSNAGNGSAGPIVEGLEAALPFKFVRMHHEPDGRFPNGVPNPMLERSRQQTGEATRRAGADLGLAWDGDCDRCFFFDERGAPVESYYLVGLLAERFLQRHPGATIVHDPRVVWNTEAVVRRAGGRAVQACAGHAFIKAAMRSEDAVYGGEMSGHHYFRDFSYCDSGMLPWLLVCELLSERGLPLSALVADSVRRFPISGEINLPLIAPEQALESTRARYLADAEHVDVRDGLSMAFARWRFNLRPSNTEPLLRLNVETRGDAALLAEKTSELLDALRARGA